MPSSRPTFLFAYADDRRIDGRPLRNLPAEQRGIQQAFERLVETGRCDLVEVSNARLDDVFDRLLGDRWGDRITVFHFAGHAGDAALIFETDEGAPAPAAGAGLASVLGRQKALQLFFLNGCATNDHALRLLGAGVPAVIVTEQAIDDAVAAELAKRFYQGIAAGRTIQRAFDDATATLETRFGDDRRGAYDRSFVPQGKTPLSWPWRLHSEDGQAVRLMGRASNRRRIKMLVVLLVMWVLALVGEVYRTDGLAGFRPFSEPKTVAAVDDSAPGAEEAENADHQAAPRTIDADRNTASDPLPIRPSSRSMRSVEPDLVPITVVLNAKLRVASVFVDETRVAPDEVYPTGFRIQVARGNHAFELVAADGRRCLFDRKVVKEAFITPNCSWEIPS